MEFETQPSKNPSHVYVTAPTSPNGTSMEFYYSAPSSPRHRSCTATIGDRDQNTSSNFDNFEFETSKKFSGQLNFLTSQDPEFRGHDIEHKYQARCDSLPSMTFADELFLNGLVMPLKLPPRLQYDSDPNTFTQKSPVLSPRTMCKIPFARKTSWNDDFDPFVVAMEKVREEKRGRNSLHRRSRSHSPFRAMPKCSNDYINSTKENSPLEEAMQVPKLRHSGPLDFKGSNYARWVRDHTREVRLSQRGPKSPRGFLFGQRVRPVKTEHDGPDCSIGERVKEESKVKKLKGLFLRYASFVRKEVNTSSEACNKASYFSRLSFKFKGKGQSNTKMAVVQYKPSVCLGYGGRKSSSNMK